MAPGLKTWFGLLGLSVALVGLWLLPPKSESAIAPIAEEAHFRELQDEVRTQVELIDRLRWADELVAELQSAREADEPVVVVDLGPRDLPAKTTRSRALVKQFNETLATELAENRAGSGQVDLGVFAVEMSSPDRVDTPRGFLDLPEYYVGVANGHPYCIIASVQPHRWADRGYVVKWGASAGGAVLGACGFVLRYGVPGPAVYQWLKNGSARRADMKSVPIEHFDFESGQVVERALLGGLGAAQTYGFSLTATACLRGSRSACAGVFHGAAEPPRNYVQRWIQPLRASLSSAVPELWVETASAGFGIAEYGMLYDLEHQFGEERFAKFWTSQSELDVAFEDAFATSTGDWMLSWVKARFPVPAQLLGRRAILVFQTLALAAGVLIIALQVSKRRQVA
jgi:hypothetical protein